MRRLNSTLRAVIHAFHTALAGKFPVRAVARKYYGLRRALFDTQSTVVAVVICNEGFGQDKPTNKIIPECDWSNQNV